jgi:hypothetical protein
VTAVQGLEPQEVVAVNGFDKLLDGAKVSIRTPAKGSGGASGQQPQTSQDNQSSPSGSSKGGSAGGKNGAPPR